MSALCRPEGMAHKWGCSSVGRAPALQAGGSEFEPRQLHFCIIGVIVMILVCIAVAIVFFGLGFYSIIGNPNDLYIDGTEITGFFIFGVVFLVLGVLSLIL